MHSMDPMVMLNFIAFKYNVIHNDRKLHSAFYVTFIIILNIQQFAEF